MKKTNTDLVDKALQKLEELHPMHSETGMSCGHTQGGFEGVVTLSSSTYHEQQRIALDVNVAASPQ